MKKFLATRNDGTLVISNKLEGPAQGTWISEQDDGTIVTAKGIGRPCLRNPYTGEVEEEAACIEAAFGKKLTGNGKFYRLGEVGRNRCKFALQTALFSTKNPAALIRHDTERFAGKSALDFLGRDSAIKVKHGIPPALLMEQMAPWDEFRIFEVPGVRATVYGSNLVPSNASQVHESFPKANRIILTGFEEKFVSPCFMLLPGSAEELARKVGVEPHELIGRYFLIHRDPALPDGTSLYPALYCGILEWDNGNTNDRYGVILNPQDPFWADAGGDFDGDAAAVYEPAEWLLPHGATGRPDYKTHGRKYISEDVGGQIIEAAGDTVAGLLGTTILSAMRLIERGINDLRPTLAAVAHASVQSKKHSVDTEVVTVLSKSIGRRVREEGSVYPFISDYLNAVKNSSGSEGKVQAWLSLVQAVEAGIWDEGTEIEQALAERVRVVNQLYKDVEFFRQFREATLPAPLRDAAKFQCTELARSEIIELTKKYRDIATQLSGFDEYDDELEDGESKEGAKAYLVDQLRVMRSQFQLACVTGRLPGVKVPVKEAQTAMVAWGPARLVARFVPASLLQELGVNTPRLATQLCDHDWKNGEYSVEDLRPIPSCKSEFEFFVKGREKVSIQIISQGPRSTRVMVTAQ